MILLLFPWVGNAPASDKKDLLSELEIMKTLPAHPHVIKLLGCVTSTGRKWFIHREVGKLNSSLFHIVVKIHYLFLSL